MPRHRIAASMLVPLAAVLAVAQDAPPKPPEPAQPAAPAPPAIDAKAERKLSSGVCALAVSPDGQWIAAGVDDGSVVLFATASAERRDAGKVDRYVSSVVFSADSQWVLAEPSDKDGMQVLVAADVATGKVLRKIDVSAPVPADGSRAGLDRFYMAVPVPGGAQVEILRNKTFEIWDLATGERAEQRDNKDPWIQSKVRAADASLVVFNVPGALRIVAGDTGAQRFEFKPEGSGMKGNVLIGAHYATAAGFATAAGVLLVRDSWDETKDPKTLTADNLDKRTKEFRKLLAISTKDGKQVWKRDLPEHAYADDIVVGADTAAVASDGKIEFVNCTNGQLREKVPGTKKWSCAAVSPDGLTFWGGAEDGSVVLLKTFPAPKAK